MILDIPPANGHDNVRNERRVRSSANDGRRQNDASSLPVPGAGYADVMNQVELAKLPRPAATSASAKSPHERSLWENVEFGFGDFLDIINPLHHIPIVATLYRNFTTDKIGLAPRVIGGALWGRIGGFVAGLVNAAVEWFTGKDIGDHIFAAVWGEKKPDNHPVTAQTTIGRTGDDKDAAPANLDAMTVPRDLSLGPIETPKPQRYRQIEKVSPDTGWVPSSPIPPPLDALFLRRLHDFNHQHGQAQNAKLQSHGAIRLIA